MIFTEKKIEVQEIASFSDHNSEVLFFLFFPLNQHYESYRFGEWNGILRVQF